jgi:hypothetical protein
MPIVAVATAVVGALFLGELGGWIDRLAVYLVRLAARLVPAEARDEFREQWYAELKVVGSGWAKLLFAISLGFHSFRIRRLVRKSRPREIHEDKQVERRYFYRTAMILGIITSLISVLLVVTLTTTSLKQTSVTVASLLAAIAALNGIVVALVGIFTISHRRDISVNDEEDGNVKDRVDK